MSTFSLKIISTDKVFYDGKCEYLVIPTIDGEKGILAHHENMVIAVEIGEASSEAEHSGVLSVTGFYGPCYDTTESVQKQTRGYLESQKNELFS